MNNPGGRKSRLGKYLWILVLIVLVEAGCLGYIGWRLFGTCVVKFDLNAAGETVDHAPEIQKLERNESASRPPFPTREGYIFDGWYLDAAGTIAYDFAEPVTGNVTLYAAWVDAESEEALLTEEEIQEFSDCVDALSSACSEYMDSDGYVAEENRELALDSIEAVAKEWMDKGVLVYWERNAGNIYVEFSSCLTYIQSVPEEGMLSGGNDDAVELVFPFYSDLRWFCNTVMDSAEVYEESETLYKDEEVTLDSLKNLKAANLFVWLGHGNLTKTLGNCLLIGESMAFKALEEYPDKSVLEQDSLMIREKYITIDQGHYAILDKFVRRYFPKMNGGMVILNTCYSVTVDNLAMAFMDLGAEIVIGYNGSVKGYYAAAIQYVLLHYMSTENEKGRYDTVEEAMEKAEDLLGMYSNVPINLNDYKENSYAPLVTEIIEQGSTDNISIYAAGVNSSNTQVLWFRNEAYEWASESVTDYTLWSGLCGTLVNDQQSNMDMDLSSIKLTVTDEEGNLIDTINAEDDGSFVFNRLSDKSEKTYTLTISSALSDVPLKVIDSIGIQAHRYLDLGEIALDMAEADIYVYNEDGEFLSDASVYLEDSKGNICEMNLSSDEDGNEVYKTWVAPSDYVVNLLAYGYESAAYEISIEKSCQMSYTLSKKKIGEDYLLSCEYKTERFGDLEKKEYYYYPDGTLFKTREYEGAVGDDGETLWELVYETQYSYSKTEEFTYTHLDCYLMTGATPVTSSYRSYIYDSNGNLAEEHYSYYSNSSSVDGTSYNYLYTYNADGTLAQELTQRYISGQWWDYIMREYTYERGVLVSSTTRPLENNPVTDTSKTEYVSNSRGLCEEAVQYVMQNGEYQKVSREEHEYDEYGNEIEYREYRIEEGKEELSVRKVYTFDENSHMLQFKYYSGGICTYTYDYEYQSPEECSLELLRTFYGMNDSAVLTQEEAEKYREVLKTYENRYGETREKEVEYIEKRLCGVVYVNLLDFNGDGTEELVIGYTDEEDYVGERGVDVWTIEGGNAKKVYEGNYCNGGGAGDEKIQILEEDGVYYIYDAFYGGVFSGSYYTLRDGAFVCVHTIEQGEGTASSVDGATVGDETIQEELIKYRDAYSYPVWKGLYKDFSNQYLMLETMKNCLAVSG